MDTYSLISIAIGILVPLVVAIIKRPDWSGKITVVVTLLVSVGVSVAQVAAAGHLDLNHLGATLALVYAASQATYHGVYKPSGAADALDRATSPKPAGDVLAPVDEVPVEVPAEATIPLQPVGDEAADLPARSATMGNAAP